MLINKLGNYKDVIKINKLCYFRNKRLFLGQKIDLKKFRILRWLIRVNIID